MLFWWFKLYLNLCPNSKWLRWPFWIYYVDSLFCSVGYYVNFCEYLVQEVWIWCLFDDLYSIWSVNISTIQRSILLHGLGVPQYTCKTSFGGYWTKQIQYCNFWWFSGSFLSNAVTVESKSKYFVCWFDIFEGGIKDLAGIPLAKEWAEYF